MGVPIQMENPQALAKVLLPEGGWFIYLCLTSVALSYVVLGSVLLLLRQGIDSVLCLITL